MCVCVCVCERERESDPPPNLWWFRYGSLGDDIRPLEGLMALAQTDRLDVLSIDCEVREPSVSPLLVCIFGHIPFSRR